MIPATKWIPPAERPKRKYPIVGRIPRRKYSPLQALRKRVAEPLAKPEVAENWRVKARRKLDPAFDRACTEHERYPKLTLEELASRYRRGVM